jgi:hypothetical protein
MRRLATELGVEAMSVYTEFLFGLDLILESLDKLRHA